MADHPLESMAEESGLDPAAYADVTAMCGAVQTAAADLPVPTPGTELVAMLGAPPVRRIARRRRIASAAGATALVLGSVGGAAAADVLPEPVQGVVTEFPGFPGGPAPAMPGAPPTSADASSPDAPSATPSADPYRFGAALEGAPPLDVRSRSSRPDDLPGKRNGTDKRPAAPPAGRSPRPAPGAPDEPGSRSSDRSDRSDRAGSSGPSDGNADGWPGQRRPLPWPVEGGSDDADPPSSTAPSQRR